MLYTTQNIRYNSVGYTGGRWSPAAIGGAIGVHAIVITAAMLMPAEIITRLTPPMFPTTNIPMDKPKDTPPEAKPTEKSPSTTQAQRVKPAATSNEPVLPGKDTDGWQEGGKGTGEPSDAGPTILVPPRQPVFVAAGFDPARMRDVQPPYPGAMVRQQIEGTVTVRVHITPQGTVDRVERISATTDAFWDATRRQALKYWRFRPATLDGAAIESERVLTVKFALN
jgi:periplasmic protein TonB